MLRPSGYSVFVPLKRGRRLAYNALSGALAVWEAEDVLGYEALVEGHPSLDARPFLHGGFLVRPEVDELEVLQQQYQAHRFDTRTLVLTLAPTLACNFGCDYCFQGANKPGDAMSEEVQEAILHLVGRAAHRLQRVHIAWYGGEPLMRRTLLETLSDRLLELCQKRGLAYDAMMVSNGYLLTGEVAQSLHARRVNAIQVTLDGIPAYHDQRRTLLNGRPTFERILRNLQEVVETVPIQLSIRVNIDGRNAADIHRLIDHMAALSLGHRKNLKLYFAPVEAITEGCHAITDLCMSKSDYGQLEAELYRHGHEAGLTALPYPPRFRGTCAAVRPTGFVIIPNGDVHKCWDTVSTPAQRIGHVSDLDGLATSALGRRWLEWTPFENSSCRSCKLLPSCAGACAYKFIHTTETRGEAARLPCPSWKYNIKEQLLLRAERMGALGPDDFDALEARTRPEELCTDTNPSTLHGEAPAEPTLAPSEGPLLSMAV